MDKIIKLIELKKNLYKENKYGEEKQIVKECIALCNTLIWEINNLDQK